MGFLRNNALTLSFLALFFIAIAGQAYFGFKEYNEELSDIALDPVDFSAYLSSGHFIQATFENWESEFLQMALFVVLTIFLIQKGSSESKDPDKAEEVDRARPETERRTVAGPPWRMGAGPLQAFPYHSPDGFVCRELLSPFLRQPAR